MLSGQLTLDLVEDYTCLFVWTIRLVFISPKKIIQIVWGKTRACIILFSWIILIFLTTGFLSLEIPVTCELFVPLWDGFCSLMALGLF